MATAADVPVLSADPTRKRASRGRRALAARTSGASAAASRSGAIGGFIVVVMLFVAIFVDAALVGSDRPLLAPTGYNAQVFGEENLSASLEHPMGTDQSGIDILSRVLYGIRISTVIGLSGVAIAVLLSMLLGHGVGVLRRLDRHDHPALR